MTITTVRAGEAIDIDTIRELLARAFDHDPITGWLIPDPGLHIPVMSNLFATLTEHAIKEGDIDVLVDDEGTPLATALWLNRTLPQTPAPDIKTDAHLNEIFGQYVPRWHTLTTTMNAAHPALAHQYQMAIGVRPDLHRHGFGTRLLDAAHARIGPQTTYLAATTPDSRRLYRRHGYTDLGTPLQIPGGPPIWPMLRPLAPSPSAAGSHAMALHAAAPAQPLPSH